MSTVKDPKDMLDALKAIGVGVVEVATLTGVSYRKLTAASQGDLTSLKMSDYLALESLIAKERNQFEQLHELLEKVCLG